MDRSVQFALYVTVSLALFLLPAKEAKALVDIGGGWLCQEASVMGQFQGYVNCQQYNTGDTSGPVGPDDDLWEYSGGNGGSGGSGSVSLMNQPNNPEPATCHSGLDERRAHANKDAWYTQNIRFSTGQGRIGAGRIVSVTYDDGGTEQWVLALPLGTEPLGQGGPLPGTLHCPSN